MVCLRDINWLGCAIVAGSILVNIPVAGFMQSFGVFVQRFDQLFCRPDDCLLYLGWVAALPMAINLMVCLVVVRVQNKFGDRWPFVIGVVICSSSLLASSFIDNLYWLLASYCFVYGVASSMVMYIPIAVIEYNFPFDHPQHVLATSIGALGAPIGIMVMNPLAAYLDRIETADWRDTFKIFALVIAIAGIFPSLVMNRPRRDARLAGYDEMAELEKDEVTTEKSSTCIKQLTVIGKAVYPTSVLWCSAMFLIAYAIFIPKTHFINYMVTLGIDPEMASFAVGYSGVTEAIATFTVSILGTILRKKLLWFYIIGTVTLAISNVVLIFAKEYFELIIYSLVHGTMDAFLMTLTYPVLSKIAREPEHQPILFGMTQLSIGLGQMLGLPMTGFIYDITKSYTTTFILCSATFSCAAAMIIIMYVVIFTYRKRQKQLRREQLKQELIVDEAPINSTDSSDSDTQLP